MRSLNQTIRAMTAQFSGTVVTARLCRGWSRQEFCFCSWIMQNCKAACALMRFVVSAQGIHGGFHWFQARDDFSGDSEVGVSSADCPRSISAFCTGLRNCRNLANISARLLHLVLQSKMTLTSLLNSRLTYGWRALSLFVGECLNTLTTLRTLLTVLWYSSEKPLTLCDCICSPDLWKTVAVFPRRKKKSFGAVFPRHIAHQFLVCPIQLSSRVNIQIEVQRLRSCVSKLDFLVQMCQLAIMVIFEVSVRHMSIFVLA